MEPRHFPLLSVPCSVPCLPNIISDYAFLYSIFNFFSEVQIDSSNTLKKKCAKLKVAPGSSGSWSITGVPLHVDTLWSRRRFTCSKNVCSGEVSHRWDQWGKEPKAVIQTWNSGVTVNNHELFLKDTTKQNYQPHLRLRTPQRVLLLQKQELHQVRHHNTTKELSQKCSISQEKCAQSESTLLYQNLPLLK